MVRFTLFFKDTPIQSYVFETGVIYIGRDDTNNIAIDSLAVAPIHAIVIIHEVDCLIKQVNNEYPLIVNDQPYDDYYLTTNDRISIGKHALLFSQNNAINEYAIQDNIASSHTAENEISDAKLQVIDGKHIGRIIPVKKAITRMGRSGEGVIIISRRKDGYFISALESNINLTINQKSLDDQIIKLSHHDLISIDNISMQFFLD
ncbi:MAG: FHA domain-containing protein [Methylococcaceae bacterium]|nr:FHA domain-containing protein [Methylococcaceae bacterium]